MNDALDEVLTKLDKEEMSINYRKTVHFSNEILYLGYKINAKGIHPDPRLAEMVSNILPTKNKKELEQFLGLVNFYGRFIKNFAQEVLALTELRNRDTYFLGKETSTLF